ncbi:MAG: hypothetical protein CMK09_16100 [Ponticaulis sp.]|nr:hypothetical protein [Ponticaulis sp.]|tara:strand:- start:50527 stop:51132 length:606 start_codon:yes stop_codon:yes gene_type:complete
MSRRRAPKKTELLEVRIDPETKDRLRQKAGQEGKTISNAVRDLIDDYIAPITEDRPTSNLRRSAGLATAIAGLAVVIFGGTRLAYAEATNLELSAAFSKQNGDVLERRTVKTTVRLSDDEYVVLDLPPTGDQQQLVLLVKLTPKDNEENLLSITIKEGEGENAAIIGEPRLVIRNDKPAKIVFDAGGEYSYTIDAKASAPD